LGKEDPEQKIALKFEAERIVFGDFMQGREGDVRPYA
jgi:hypothetical protein